MTNEQLEYRMAPEAKSRTIFCCLAFAGSIGMFIALYCILFDKDAGSEKNLYSGLIFGFIVSAIIFLFQSRDAKKLFNRVLKITADAIELNGKTQNRLLFSEIENVELWVNLNNEPVNLAVIGTETRIDITDFENLNTIIELVKKRIGSKTLWEKKQIWWSIFCFNPLALFVLLGVVPSGVMIIFARLSSGGANFLPYQNQAWGIEWIALGILCLLTTPAKVDPKLPKYYRTVQIISGIYFITRGIRFFIHR